MTKKIPKMWGSGPIRIGDAELDCYILEDGTKEAYTTYVYISKDSLVNAIIEDNGAKVLALALGQFVRGREISNPVTPPKLC